MGEAGNGQHKRWNLLRRRESAVQDHIGSQQLVKAGAGAVDIGGCKKRQVHLTSLRSQVYLKVSSDTDLAKIFRLPIFDYKSGGKDGQLQLFSQLNRYELLQAS